MTPSIMHVRPTVPFLKSIQGECLECYRDLQEPVFTHIDGGEHAGGIHFSCFLKRIETAAEGAINRVIDLKCSFPDCRHIYQIHLPVNEFFVEDSEQEPDILYSSEGAFLKKIEGAICLLCQEENEKLVYSHANGRDHTQGFHLSCFQTYLAQRMQQRRPLQISCPFRCETSYEFRATRLALSGRPPLPAQIEGGPNHHDVNQVDEVATSERQSTKRKIFLIFGLFVWTFYRQQVLAHNQRPVLRYSYLGSSSTLTFALILISLYYCQRRFEGRFQSLALRNLAFERIFLGALLAINIVGDLLFISDLRD